MSSLRMFPHDPPRITFTKDFQQLVHGNLLPGREVLISYDAERLPQERSKVNGQKAWTIKCFYQFADSGEVGTLDLWSESGEILTKYTNDIGEGTMMVCRLQIPQEATHLSIWFQNTGLSGAIYWDTNFGTNYVFRFVVNDVQITEVSVTKEPAEFHIAVSASPEVENLAALYRIMNDPLASLEQDTRLDLKAGAPDSSGRVLWSGSTPVPVGAVVRFTLAYDADGSSHADTNNRKGYLTWAGAQRNREMGVL